MNVLMISMDRDVLKPDTAVQRRLIEYGKLCESLHVVVFSGKLGLANSKLEVSNNVFVYPTNSFSRFFYPFDAYKISSSIIRNWKLEIRNCVITCQDPYETGLVGLWLKKRFNLPLQVQIHGDMASTRYWGAGPLLDHIRALIGPRVINAADSFRVVSHRVKKILQGRFGIPENKIAVIPIATEIEKFQKEKARFNLYHRYGADIVLLCVGRLEKVKNIDLQIKALPLLLKRWPKLVLVIVGEGSEQKNLESLAERLSVRNSVYFEGRQDDIVSYYKSADVLLLTSHSEGWGSVVIEAMASGLPVVMSNVGLAGYILKDGESGVVLKENTIDELERAVVKLITQPQLRERLILSGQDVVVRLAHYDTKKLIYNSWLKTLNK